jgi:macrolide-specific efflux system membrane fusion protein
MPNPKEQPTMVAQLRTRTRRVASTALLLLLVGTPGAAATGQEAKPPAADEGSIVASSALLRIVEQVTTPARVAGVLASMDVAEGDVVAEGEVVAAVDDTEAKLLYQRAVTEHELARHRAVADMAIRSAEKSLGFSQQELLRLQRAGEGLPGSVSTSELEESQLTAAQARLALEQAQHDHRRETLTERLKQTELALAARNQDVHQIRAPLNGVVVEILRRRGEWVEPGEDVLRIMRIDRLRAEGLVDVQHVLRDLRGAPATISVSVRGRPEVTLPGKVVFVNPEINPVNGQVRVRVEFDNPGGRLMPGMRANLVIGSTPQVSASSVPGAEAGDALGGP